MLKKILIGLLVIFVAIQFIRPSRNISTAEEPQDISAVYTVPDGVYVSLQKACYDCHSNNTTYPWYANVQPVGWWLQHHINEGKDELNFSIFGNYTAKRQAHKMEEIAEMIEKNEMPIESYTWQHSTAKLSPQEKQDLIHWANALETVIKTKAAAQ